MSDAHQHHSSFEVEEEQPSALRLAAWGIGLLIVLFVTVQALVAIFHQTSAQKIYEEQLAPVSPLLTELRKTEEMQITGYGWLDKTQNRVKIPIERAMELVVKESAEARP